MIFSGGTFLAVESREGSCQGRGKPIYTAEARAEFCAKAQ